MLTNGDDEDEKILEMLEKRFDRIEKYKKIITVLAIITLILLLFLLAAFSQNSKIMIVDASSKENEVENEIKNFSIPEIIYKSFESRIKEKGNSNFKIITSVEKFNNMTFIEKNRELADIQKILRNNEIEKECNKDFYELSSTIYCRKRQTKKEKKFSGQK